MEKDSNKLGVALILAAIFGLAAVWLIYYHGSDETGSGQLAILFALPIIFQAVVLLMTLRKDHLSLRKLYVFFFLFGPIACIVFWVIYIDPKPNKSNWGTYSDVAIFLSCILVGLAGFVTYHIIKPRLAPKDQPVSKLGGAVSSRPFSSLMFFLAMFLSVTYLLSFAFAFHDKYEIDITHSGIGGLYQCPLPNVNKSMTQPSSSLREPFYGIIYFDKNKAQLDELFRLPSGGQENRDVLNAIVEGIIKFANYERIRIVLVGHASEEGQYSKNCQLSEVRTHSVQLYISKQLSELSEGKTKRFQNIEWLLSHVSNERNFLGEIPSHEEKRRCVEVAIIHIPNHPTEILKTGHRPLQLLDYVYFTIYTITTTGYGDILPVTEQAKFISCLANLFELFFLVVFFNALLTFHASKGHKLPEGYKKCPFCAEIIKEDAVECKHCKKRLDDSMEKTSSNENDKK